MTDIPLNAVLTISNRCAWQVMDNKVVVVDLVNRRIMGLNSTGSLLWQWLDGLQSVQALIRRLSENVHQTEAQVADDVYGLLSELISRQLITPTTPSV